MTTRVTLSFETVLYQTLKLRAAETGQTLSALMNEALQAQFSEDLEDITSLRKRRALRETPLPYEVVLKELQGSGSL